MNMILFNDIMLIFCIIFTVIVVYNIPREVKRC